MLLDFLYGVIEDYFDTLFGQSSSFVEAALVLVCQWLATHMGLAFAAYLVFQLSKVCGRTLLHCRSVATRQSDLDRTRRVVANVHRLKSVLDLINVAAFGATGLVVGTYPDRSGIPEPKMLTDETPNRRHSPTGRSARALISGTIAILAHAPAVPFNLVRAMVHPSVINALAWALVLWFGHRSWLDAVGPRVDQLASKISLSDAGAVVALITLSGIAILSILPGDVRGRLEFHKQSSVRVHEALNSMAVEARTIWMLSDSFHKESVRLFSYWIYEHFVSEVSHGWRTAGSSGQIRAATPKGTRLHHMGIKGTPAVTRRPEARVNIAASTILGRNLRPEQVPEVTLIEADLDAALYRFREVHKNLTDAGLGRVFSGSLSWRCRGAVSHSTSRLTDHSLIGGGRGWGQFQLLTRNLEMAEDLTFKYRSLTQSSSDADALDSELQAAAEALVDEYRERMLVSLDEALSFRDFWLAVGDSAKGTVPDRLFSQITK